MPIFTLVVLLFISGATHACSCGIITIEEKIETSDYVYLGQIIKANLKENGTVENTLKPIEIFKGSPEHWLLESPSRPIKQCRVYAAVGLKYIVYGKLGQIPYLSLCGYSQPIGESYEKAIRNIRKAAEQSVRVKEYL